jgi:hypothetical protein
VRCIRVKRSTHTLTNLLVNLCVCNLFQKRQLICDVLQDREHLAITAGQLKCIHVYSPFKPAVLAIFDVLLLAVLLD